jgi:hypothetical protein
MEDNTIYIVTGLPRSGTSLAMQLLNAAGIKIFSDGIRQADINNLKGYFESEKVLLLPRDTSWLKDAEGSAIKVVLPLVRYLPDNFTYKFIFMDRALEEVVKSQEAMLKVLDKKGAGLPAEKLIGIFEAEIQRYTGMLEEKSAGRICYVPFSSLFDKSGEILHTLATFLGRSSMIEEMKAVVDPGLYRSRI